MNNNDISKIKLIIWDLDETFWDGILSEHTQKVKKENIQLIKDLTDCGIVNSICSKNDESLVDDELKKIGLFEYFVFKSVNWSPKGSRIREIITSMNLRPENVLFIDDNHLNRQEAKSIVPSIMVADADCIDQLIVFFSNLTKTDINHKRLNQYKILEKKNEFRTSFGSNEDFLNECDIKLSISHNCLDSIDRIHELLLRANQLNFTKKRPSIEELKEQITKATDCGCVFVSDKFGDYGIVGFYLLNHNQLVHFTFSCRTIGMGIEQYVFHYLNKPHLDIVGEVSSSLNCSKPTWINKSSKQIRVQQTKLSKKIVIKGPCDLALTSLYFNSKNCIEEFVYLNSKGISIEQYNHTSIICDSLKLTDKEKLNTISSVPFMDPNVYKTKIFDNDICLVILSMFTDPNLGIYRDRKSGHLIPFGEYTNDLTDENNWDSIIKGETFTANYHFTIEELKYIKDNFDFEGRLSVKKIVENVEFISKRIAKKCKLLLILGSELEFKENKQPAYADRHLFNKQLNSALRLLASQTTNILLLDVNSLIDGQESFTNNINHFKKIVYFKMAQQIVSICNNEGIVLSSNGSLLASIRMFFRRLKKVIKNPVRYIRSKT